ncbi:hypothetical protein AAMO2058_001541700 [Amorphochlora amoebiformis]
MADGPAKATSMMGGLAEDIFLLLIEEMCLDLCVASHRRHYFQMHLKAQPKVDIFGNYPKNTSEQFRCMHCQKPVSSTKFAPHLEKCMGRGGRNRAKRSDR